LSAADVPTTERLVRSEMKKPKVLFLCTHNSARSQMAEAFLKRYGGDQFDAYSAGLEPTELHPLARKVMEEIGFDMNEHRSKDLRQFLGKTHFGYLVTVCARAESECPIFPGVAVRLHWPFEDPASFEGSEEENTNKFREIRDQIRERVKLWVKEFSPAER
jgi:arsenate reductase (thioredoxin)